MTNWTSLGAPSAGIPKLTTVCNFPVAVNKGGRLEVCTLASDGTLWHIWQLSAGGAWSNWTSLGTPPTVDFLAYPPAMEVNVNGRLEAFAFGFSQGQNSLWHISQINPGSNWSSWEALNAPDGHGFPVTAVNGDGRIEVFVTGSGGTLWHAWQDMPQISPGGIWRSWYWRGLPPAQLPNFYFRDVVATARNADGRIEVFVIDRYGLLWHIWQETAGGIWSAWYNFNLEFGGTSSPSAKANRDGRLEVFIGASMDGAVYHIWQLSAGGAWSNWRSLGAPTGSVQPNTYTPMPSVGVNSDGRLEVFATGSDGALWHIWQLPVPPLPLPFFPRGAWSNWASLGTPPNVASVEHPSSVATNADGRLEVFVMGSDGALWHAWQEVAGGAWG
jgi:hypothetical protein